MPFPYNSKTSYAAVNFSLRSQSLPGRTYLKAQVSLSPESLLEIDINTTVPSFYIRDSSVSTPTPLLSISISTRISFRHHFFFLSRIPLSLYHFIIPSVHAYRRAFRLRSHTVRRHHIYIHTYTHAISPCSAVASRRAPRGPSGTRPASTENSRSDNLCVFCNTSPTVIQQYWKRCV